MHSVAIPRGLPRRSSARARCSTIRLPLVPTGWPRLIAPPSTLSRSGAGAVTAPSLPSRSRHRLSSSQTLRQASTWAAKASLISQRSTASIVSPWRCISAVLQRTGASPMIEGSSARQALSRMRASGSSRRRSTVASEASSVQQAPSVTCEALPAVTCPYGRSNAGFSRLGRKPVNTCAPFRSECALRNAASQRTPGGGISNGEWLSASAPPASTRSARPFSISWRPVSIDCIPEPQLICTVNAGIAAPSPRRSAAMRAGLASSARTLTQPRTTWSIALAAAG